MEAAATALGLEPLSALDPALSAAIIALHRPPMPDPTTTQTWSLTRIYRYPESGASCYSITVHVDEIRQVLQQGRTIRTESRETRVVALVAPKSLQAPRMQVLPRALVDPAAGALARMAVETANAMIDAAAAQGGDRVEFADPAFDSRYLVLSPDPIAARAFLDSTRRQQLAGFEGLQVSVEGSLMLVSFPTDAIRHRGRPLEKSLRAELEIARRALTMFDAAFSRT